MKKKLLFKRLCSIILAVVLLISAIPISLAVQDLLIEETASKIVREVTELREESVKHFLCEDGSYIAVSYSEPVHYKENGEWKEIDNTLKLSSKALSASGEQTYAPKAGNLSVSIPQSFSDGQQITASNKGHTISFGVASGEQNVSLEKTASVVDVEALPSNIEQPEDVVALNTAEVSLENTVEISTEKTVDNSSVESYNNDRMAVENQSGAVVYEEIFPDSDLEYIVTGSSIKENIVVYEPQSEYVYAFDMDLGGLVPKAEDDGSIIFVDETKPEEIVFVLAAPYMYDAGGEESLDIEMSLTENGDTHLLTVTANAEWINSSERIFPVVIDPTLYFEYDDVYVIDGISANSPRVNTEIRIGRNLANVARTYIKMDVPTIPTGSVVTNSRLVLKQDDYFQALSQDDIEVYVYDCNNVDSWDIDTVSWNNQPFDNSDNGYQNSGATRLSSVSADRETYDFDITPAAKRWFETGVCEGLMLASSDETSKTQVDFYSSRALTSSNRPYIWYTYIEPSVSPNAWQTTKDVAVSPEITVTASGSWTVSADQPWISLSASSGTGISTFTMSVSENTSAYERTGTVTVYIGNTEIGKVEVIQSGTAPYLYVDKEVLTLDYQDSKNNLVAVTTNAEWDFEYDNSANEWLNVNKNASGNGLDIEVTLNAEIDPDGTEDVLPEREVYETRSATITVTTDTGNEKEITVIQLNEPLSYFNTINADGSLTLNSSSEYNHALATWAMELSYAAYNPISNSEAIPGIPGDFREPPFDNDEWTAKAELESKGFTAREYNYDGGVNSVAAHTIGHRTIEINNIEFNNDNLTGEIENDGYTLEYRNDTMDVCGATNTWDSINSVSVNSETLGITSVLNSEELTSGHRTIEINNIEFNNDNLTGEIENDGYTLGSVSDVRLHSGTSGFSDTVDSVCDLSLSGTGLGNTDQVVLNSYSTETESNNTRHLVVVSVRGSVTMLDWAMDLFTQFHVKALDFEAGSEMVLESLYGYDDCTECDGSDENCPCKGYLVNNGITNPIILITGHSMGAAIANLVAAEVTEREGQADVYAYTFATPTVKSATDGNATTRYTNIFNILNTNDVVTYVPTSWLLPTINLWSRHGIDIPLNMPYSDEEETDFLGFEPHSMAVYMSWMVENEGITYDGILEESSKATVRGLLPKFLQVKCPVGVTVKDSDGNIIAYESQEEDVTYPEVTDTGIVSWITDDGEKMFFIPSGVDAANIEIEAYDYGSMDFAFGTAGTTDETEIKVFNDVTLYPGKEFLVEVSEDVLPEDTQLFVTENGEIVGEVTETDPPFKGITAEQTELTYGTPMRFTITTDQTVSEIQLHNRTDDYTLTLVEYGIYVSDVSVDGDNLIWTVGFYPNPSEIGQNIFDISVKSGEKWYDYSNVIAISVLSNN